MMVTVMLEMRQVPNLEEHVSVPKFILQFSTPSPIQKSGDIVTFLRYPYSIFC